MDDQLRQRAGRKLLCPLYLGCLPHRSTQISEDSDQTTEVNAAGGLGLKFFRPVGAQRLSSPL